ncbi:hypothetical protein ABKV19_004452 [Rosa sericea]
MSSPAGLSVRTPPEIRKKKVGGHQEFLFTILNKNADPGQELDHRAGPNSSQNFSFSLISSSVGFSFFSIIGSEILVHFWSVSVIG